MSESSTTDQTTMGNSASAPSPVTVPYEVLLNLYISEFPVDIDPRFTHILNMCTQPHPLDANHPTQKYHQILINDIDNITPHIPAIISFISTAIKEENGTVLVYYHAGINRSVSAIVAYLCHSKG